MLPLKNEDAIKRSVQNLVRINIGEVFFNELIGTRVEQARFELANDDFVDSTTQALLRYRQGNFVALYSDYVDNEDRPPKEYRYY